MRRVILAALLLIALAACSSRQERPEGIVERWLLALNQGSAGEPGRYAPADVSEAVLPGWEDLEPGEFDVIEVGSADAIGATCADGSTVPFRVVPLDGEAVEDAACVVGSQVSQLTPIRGIPGPIFPSEGGPPVTEYRASAWLIAVGLGVMILLASEALMRLVGSTTRG